MSSLALLACNGDKTVPSAPGLTRLDARASIVANSYPTIPFPSGIATDGRLLYISTMAAYRSTYVIELSTWNLVTLTNVGGNPKDVVYRGGNLDYSDVSSEVVERTDLGVQLSTTALPWRGGGIATWHDSLYVGNLDADSVLVLDPAGSLIRRFGLPMNVRPEGLVMDTTSNTLWVLTPFDSYLYEVDLVGNLIRKCDTPFDPSPYGLGGVTILRDTFYIAEALGGDPFAGATILRIARSELVCSPASPYALIDMKPGVFPNNLYPGVNGRIDVAMLGSASFNAASVNVRSIRFGHHDTKA